MALKFPDSADSADLTAAGYSQVIILGGGNDSVSTSATADYLILAGGGGGGGLIAGGGGAGGYRTSWGTGADGTGGNSGGLSSLETALTLNSGTAYSITVGQGGEGGLGWGGVDNQSYFSGHKGRATSISGTGISTVTTVGGGGGRGYNHNTGTEQNGGSGGGGSGGQTGGTATTGEGFAGGAVTADVGGGGGGAAAAGQGSSSNSSAGDGGDGLASTITGIAITRAGGGGGGIRASSGSDNGIGGAGGGGDGGVNGSNSHPPLSYGTVTTDRATHGRAQYGGGGGGGGYNSTGSSIVVGGNGGSGIAIFRLPSIVPYSASQLASDVSSLSNCTATYSAAADGSGDHVISFTVATEDPHDGGATTNDGTATWTPTLSSPAPPPSTTWTIPEGVDSFSIMAIGAGGAAGYSDSTSAGGGGGGGGLAYLNNIAVAQGDNEVVSITVGGGQLGIGGEADGGDATDLTVTMNLSTANPKVDLSGYNLNSYGQAYYDSDSDAAGIMFITATDNDSVQIAPFGSLTPVSVGVEGAQTLFEIEADANYTYIQSLAETDPNTTNRWGYNTLTQVYSSDSYVFRNIDNTGRNSLDSIQYYDSDVVATFFLQNTYDEMYKVSPFGTFDSIDVGNGAFTLFRIFSEADAAQIGALPGNSPYVDSNGQIVISTTGDPYDFNGYGPQDLNQILIIKNLTP